MAYLKFILLLLFSLQVHAGFVNDISAKLVDGNGTALDTLNSGSGLNALNVAFAGTNYVVSTNNSSTSQLASNASFTGLIDNSFNQQAISFLVTSDQPGTFTIKQYSDLLGTSSVPDIVLVHPRGGTSGSITLNGNYVKIVYKNTGFATTTTLNINVAYGILPATTALGNGPVALNEIGGVSVTPRADGYLRVAQEPTTKLYDTFETLNLTDTWSIGGTTLPSGTAGVLSLAPGTTANATSYAKSIPIFQPGTSAFLQMADLVQMEATAVVGNVKVFGLGVLPATPSAAIPITNGAVYETLVTDGSLWATTWSNSVRTNAVQITRPSDGAYHRYALYYKASRVYYEIDNVTVASIAFPNPQVSALSTIILSLNGTSTTSATPVLNASLIGVGDTGRNAAGIASGDFPWRVAKVNADNSLVVSDIGKAKATYSATIVGLATAAAATDVFTITGSATKTVKISRITVSGSQTTKSFHDVTILKRSTANSGGSSTTISAGPLDPADAAPTAVVRAYTANPTLGTLVFNVRGVLLPFTPTTPPNAQQNGDSNVTNFDFTLDKPLTLRGTGDVVAVNFNGQTFTGPSINIFVEWTEE